MRKYRYYSASDNGRIVISFSGLDYFTAESGNRPHMEDYSNSGISATLQNYTYFRVAKSHFYVL
ncbi:hypothetical protein TAMA11512_21840 [Selenomonas sp. TAMA-11512]|nr:hypothetical protein TAMA11512_21840 [Selenomonas sp. TAMA-11512]